MTERLTKRERIEFLLDHWADFFETMESSESTYGIGGDSGAVALMPRMSRHVSVLELVRCICVARQHMAHKAQHFMAFYSAEWRNVTRIQKVKTKGGKLFLKEIRERERVVPQWVRRQKVSDVVAFITEIYQGDAEPPQELVRGMRVATDGVSQYVTEAA